ncbi:B-box zinc finger protein 20-like [Pyrus ussuriensis x Pyrus communis]|uniref:B-box zinc finger protein 20-like n=1 Tax=Pyrus ussuriensis x Pyrus communis TaxID=2448454 RepID=A0A5N5FNH5_9ROSA|nr:B-box zinc finger protein 20-like [Pyrus ussuriensis x Pyrus communis]
MKIRCDVCDKEEATVFCSADEAALCDVCDRQIHHANKLASKHKRFSLLHPTFKNSPLCDICQERRAFLFCQEDRAILCRECDLSIHKSNEHTQKHSRFLLPGVKLSAASSLYPSSSACSNFSEVMTAKTNDARASKSSTIRQRTVSSNEIFSSSSPSLMEQTMSSSSYKKIEENYCVSDNGSGSTSSISEYLMETLPGWHVEDLLDFSYDHSNAFCEVGSARYL